MKWSATVLTDAGKVRKNNEDACLWDDEWGLLVVADGMGGHAAGEVASRLAVEVVREQVGRAIKSGMIPAVGTFAPHWSKMTRLLAASVQGANDVIFSSSQKKVEHHGMGTTVVAALLHDDVLSVVHVGDSRLYLFRHGQLRALTRDHSLVAEQVAQGILTTDQAETSLSKNILSRALGVGASVEVDAIEPRVYPGDWVLACSDGLTKMVDDTAIARVLRGETDTTSACRSLVARALDRGGQDNVTVAVAKIFRQGIFEQLRMRWRKIF